MPNGDVDMSEKQHMRRNMLPDMARKSGDFVIYEIPEKEMLQIIPGTFSSFSLLNDDAEE